ncbi:hypothetical protein MalM25_25480 [Planctomycetes bacterium MalM25]|nr:hypothetical protein MalM25_25480 [Planctomycetes bacterium MalM25]
MSEENTEKPQRGTTIEFEYIHPLQAGKVLGLMYAILALILAPLFFIGPAMQGGPEAGFAIVMAIMMAIMYPVMGFIGGALMALLYNFVAGLIGGFRIDLK